MTMHTDTTLPQIVRFIAVTDAGEFGATNCAHCGAKGRYEHVFMCADGTRRSAMAGCIQRFPVSPVALEEKRIRERQADRAKSGGKLASWDETKLAKIEAFYDGTLTEGQALAWIADENAKRDSWLRRRNGGRR